MEGGRQPELTRLALLSALLLAACGGPGLTPRPVEIVPAGADQALTRWSNGWRLSKAPPRFPYNSETVVFAGMSGAGTGAPFGCGVEYAPAGYFSMARGPLVCVFGQPDGALRLASVGDGLHYRVFDAAPTAGGLTVVTAPLGGGLMVLTLSPQGEVLGRKRLPRPTPDQAVILPSGRLVVVEREPGGCFWTVVDLADEAPRQVSKTPADHSYQCQSSSSARGVLRDQTTGEAYLYFDHPTPRRLYRIEEPGRAGPAALAALDIAAGTPLNENSDPGILTINDGTLLFSAGRNASFGPRIGVHDLRRDRGGYIDLPGSGSSQAGDNPTVSAFLAPTDRGRPARLVIQHPRTGHSTIETIDPSAVIYD